VFGMFFHIQDFFVIIFGLQFYLKTAAVAV
jgi:hypothetical protein